MLTSFITPLASSNTARLIAGLPLTEYGPEMPGPAKKIPKTSLKAVPTKSQYSSEAKIYSNDRPVCEGINENWILL